MKKPCECPEEWWDFKQPSHEEEKVTESEPVVEPAPMPSKERKKSWWQKLKDRLDPAGIGDLTPSPVLGY